MAEPAPKPRPRSAEELKHKNQTAGFPRCRWCDGPFPPTLADVLAFHDTECACRVPGPTWGAAVGTPCMSPSRAKAAIPNPETHVARKRASGQIP